MSPVLTIKDNSTRYSFYLHLLEKVVLNGTFIIPRTLDLPNSKFIFLTLENILLK